MDNNIAIDDLVNALIEATALEREKTEVSKKSMEQEIEYTAGYTRINGKLVSLEKQRIDIEVKLNKELEEQFGASKKLASKQETLLNDQLKQLNYAIDSNGKLFKTTLELESAQKKLISKVKEKLRNEEEQKLRQENVTKELKRGLEEIGKASWGTATQLAKGETSFTTLFPLMDAVGAAAGALAKGLLSFIPIFGEAFGNFAEKAIKTGIEISKFALEMLQRSLNTFRELSDSGALVANGMKGLNDQLVESGLSLDGFKRIVKQNGYTLAAWGGTVGAGLSKFTEAMKDLTLGPVGEDLRKLGLNADAMGESAAAFLEQEIRLGRGRNMTAKQLTEGTVQYVKELDLLQKATGLSRQDLQKQRDEMLSDGRYRASMQGVNEKNEKALTAFIGQFKDPDMKRGLMDLASGNITSEAAGKVTIALGDSAAETIRAFKEANPDDIPKIWNKAGADMKAAAENNIAMMGETYKYLEPGKLINGAVMFDMAAGKYANSMEKAKEIQDKQLADTDELTKNTVIASKEMDKLANSALEASNALLPDAADAVAKFTENLNKAIEKIKEIIGAPSAQNLPSVAAAENNRKIAEERKAEAEKRLKNAAPGSQAAKDANEDVEQARAKEHAARKIEDSAKTKESQKAFKKQGAGTPPPTQPAPPATPTQPAPPNQPTQPTPAADALKLIKFQGDSLGNKEHFDMLSSNTQNMFMEMIAKYGKSVTVTSAARTPEEQLQLWKRTVVNGTPGFLPNGNLVAEPGTSKHEVGKAIDLNRSDVEALDKEGLLKRYGFTRLAKDPPHIEMARFGGVFDGPESGYPVMLHGQEAVVPTPQFDALKEVMSSVSKSSLAGAMPTAVASSGANESINMWKSLNVIMSDKFDQMITVMERSTEIQARLLNNSMV